MRPHPPLLLALLALALPARALPPSQAWIDVDAPPSSGALALVIERDATTARLVSARAFEGSAKLASRPGDEGGLVFAVRDASGRPLLVGRTHDAGLAIHGDEPDPATGELRALGGPLERTAFLLRVPLLPGAHDLALYEEAAHGSPSGERLAEWVRSGDGALLPRGVVPLAGGTSP